ncbi:MAG: hypothetical protein R2769_06975 [Saprospiraceae bacterium]
MDTDLENERMLNFVKKVAEDALFFNLPLRWSFCTCQKLAYWMRSKAQHSLLTLKLLVNVLHLEVENVLFVHRWQVYHFRGAKSFEAALYLCEKLYSKTTAEQLARGLVIDWNLDSIPYLEVTH